MMRILSLFLFVSTVGCTTVNTYVPPIPVGAAQLDGASKRNGIFDWDSARIVAIDDKYLPPAKRVALTPEKHRVLVKATFSRRFADGGPFEAFVPVEFEVQADGRYRLGSMVRDNTIEVWVEESESGVRVSEIFSSVFSTQPTVPVTVTVPLVVTPRTATAVGR
jgi:hypothetical protein